LGKTLRACHRLDDLLGDQREDAEQDKGGKQPGETMPESDSICANWVPAFT
jgi:hypothetical protein